MLSWLHIGDLHVTDAEGLGEPRTIVEQAACFAGSVDFALLAGDVANEGTAAQYRRVRRALQDMALPVHAVPGDHDRHGGDLAAFYGGLRLPALPLITSIGGHRCLFLDVVSAGSGGLDFRLGPAQTEWLESELRRAGSDGLPSNDGRTIYAAVRSTGQVEKGPVGFAVTAIDGGVASWRFEELAAGWPFCLINTPSDERLITRPHALDQVPRGALRVRYNAWSDADIVGATCRIDDGPSWPMSRGARLGGMSRGARLGGMSRWAGDTEAADGARRLVVTVTDARGRTNADTITARISRDRSWSPPDHAADGSDADRVGPWPETGIEGGQRGPNRNGKQW